MRTLTHICVAAALVGLGVGPVVAQSAPLKDDQKKLAELERALADEKAAEAKARYAREIQVAHQQLKDELEAKARELEKVRDKLAAELKQMADAAKVPQQPPLSPLPKWSFSEVTKPASDPAAALRPLTKSSDPKVAALASELLAQLTKKMPADIPAQFGVGGGKTGQAVKVVVVSDGAEKVVKTPESYASMRMSADGKTAAVIAADGGVTVFDTASGKELMRFPVKK